MSKQARFGAKSLVILIFLFVLSMTHIVFRFVERTINENTIPMKDVLDNIEIHNWKKYINDVEKYKGKDLYVSRENAVPLEENEYYIADLIDMDIYDENDEKIGVLFDVMQTGANDVYVINMDDGRELLLPVIEDAVLDVNLEENKIKVHILDGLL